MGNAAAHVNRVRALLAVSLVMDPKEFERIVGQHPGTMQRDLEWAKRDYQQAKEAYEAYCAEIGEPAYALPPWD